MDELMNLLAQLGLGVAAHPIYDMIMDLDPESMSVPQLEQAIRRVLTLHGCEACADAVIAALGEVGFASLQSREARDGTGKVRVARGPAHARSCASVFAGDDTAIAVTSH